MRPLTSYNSPEPPSKQQKSIPNICLPPPRCLLSPRRFPRRGGVTKTTRSAGTSILLCTYGRHVHPSSPCPFSLGRHYQQLADRHDSSHSPQDFHHDCYPYQQAAHNHHYNSSKSSPKKPTAVPSPPAKKPRVSTPGGSPPPDPAREGGAVVPQRQPAALGLSSRHNHHTPASRQSPSKTTTTTTSTTTTTTNLSPCHICHRKPTKRTELDSYADCEGCGERTCYVCIRECLGWWKETPTSDAHPLAHEEALMRDDDGDDENIDDDENVDDNRRRIDGKRNKDKSWGQDGVQDQSFSMEDAPPPAGETAWSDDRTGSGGTTWGKDGGRGHRDRICSQCCVEEGPEGEAVCLGCLGT